MTRRTRPLIQVALAALLLAVAGPTLAEDVEPEATRVSGSEADLWQRVEAGHVYEDVDAGGLGRSVYDLAVLRPLGFVQLAVGAVVFVPAWPVSWLFGGQDDVYRACLTDPARRTFGRPLGAL